MTYTPVGPIGAFSSPANFKVRGQRVDVSGGSVVFVGGSAGKLVNGTKVTTAGGQVFYNTTSAYAVPNMLRERLNPQAIHGCSTGLLATAWP